MKIRKFEISPFIAKRKGIPCVFDGAILKETQKAVYIYGRGTTDPMGSCCICGRTLTHPVSILCGIGPECGQHFWDESVLGPYGFTEEHAEKLKKMVRSIIVDGWFPKSQLKAHDTNVDIEVPKNHPMRENNSDGKKKPIKKATITDDTLTITFPYNPEAVALVKTLPGRKWNPTRKEWTANALESSIQTLKEAGFTIDDLRAPEPEKPELTFVGKLEKLYPFQKAGVQFIEDHNGRAILGDEMGLGKTAQALGWAELHPELKPVLVICPASLKLNWVREVKMWTTIDDIHICQGKSPKGLPPADLYIINYDILSSWLPLLLQQKFQLVITDEAHLYKNNKAQRTKAVKKIAAQTKHFIALTGTLILNRPIEAYNAINCVNNRLFPSYWNYAMRYCGAKHNGFGWDFNGASHTDELHELIKNIMIRRTKGEVLKDLPAKIKTILPLEMEKKHLKTYKAVEEDFLAWLSEHDSEKAARAARAETLAKIEALKQICIEGKMKQAIEWIRNFIDSNGKLVTFCTHKKTIEILMQEFGDIAVKLDGSSSQNQREEAVNKFQNDESIRLFVGNIKAAGVGITLTAASSVAFLELPWTPGDLTQAEDRVHRIGQEADSINIYYLLTENTIEESIAELLSRKQKVIDAVLDGKDSDQESLLTELLNNIKRRNEK